LNIGIKSKDVPIFKNKDKLETIESGELLAASAEINSVPTQNHTNWDASENIFKLKPINKMLEGWEHFLESIKSLPNKKIVIVGGGAAGIETAFALADKLKTLNRSDKIVIIQSSDYLLDSGNVKQSKAIKSILKSKTIEVLQNIKVIRIQENLAQSFLILEDQTKFSFDFLVVANGAQSSDILKNSGLSTDVDGFLKVNKKLQSLSHSNVFGAGDCVHFDDQRLPKSGVYAVRQGEVLATNIMAYSNLGEKSVLKNYKPQKKVLKLLQISKDKVFTIWGPLYFNSNFMSQIKKTIDLNFMERFGHLPNKMMAVVTEQDINMCGGCGSKVPKSLLENVIHELRPKFPGIISDTFEDCYPLPLVTEPTFMTVDSLKEFIQDPFLFGKVSALHALSDLWVSNVKPFAGTVALGVQQNSLAVQKNQSVQMMAGILSVFKKFDIKLSNAHTYSSHENQITITAVGQRSKFLFRKSGTKTGDLIIMSKPLGTGIALQALMHGDLDLEDIKTLKETLLTENLIPDFLLEGISASTDISGFGFAGHLIEILEASNKSAEIDIAKLAVYGFLAKLKAKGHRSYLMDSNLKSFVNLVIGHGPDAIWDPQTNGPVLATISADYKNLVPESWSVVGKIIDPMAHKIKFFQDTV
jgi:selenide,water dikinase